jgi:DNA-binding CsgD family transcriptional regulator
MLGKKCYEMIGGREGPNTPYCRRNCPVISNARRGRVTPDYDLSCTTADGKAKWLNFSILVPVSSPIRARAVHLFRDVTRRREVEDFARRAGKVIRELQTRTPTDAGGDDLAPAPVPLLSRRESEVLRLLAAGLNTVQIAQALGVRPVTARNHISRLLNKLGVGNRLQAVIYASQRGLL